MHSCKEYEKVCTKQNDDASVEELRQYFISTYDVDPLEVEQSIVKKLKSSKFRMLQVLNFRLNQPFQLEKMKITAQEEYGIRILIRIARCADEKADLSYCTDKRSGRLNVSLCCKAYTAIAYRWFFKKHSRTKMAVIFFQSRHQK